MLATLLSPVRRYPLASFVILAYAFSWWTWPLYSRGVIDSPIIGFGPFVGAVIVLAVISGRAAVKDLLRRMLPARIGWVWYALALALPIVLNGIAAILTVALGAPTPAVERVTAWPNLIPTFFLLLLVPGIGGTWEEPGWRGFAWPRLEIGRSRLVASALLWIIIVGWHLPLFLYGKIEWADVVGIAGSVILMNWLFESAQRNIFVIMLMHAMNNTISGEFLSPMFTGASSASFGWLRALVWGVTALALIYATRSYWLARLPAPPPFSAKPWPERQDGGQDEKYFAS